MRIHGDLKIVRRTEIQQENDYSKYRDFLIEDFNYICGYCGKHMKVSKKGYEIDHFVPISTDGTRETDYTNLVLSCFTCNRKKSKKWPTKNKDLCHDGTIGFCDPTSEEFDTHLTRSPIGTIVHNSVVGKYMHNVFKFNIRPTDIVWKAMELEKRKRIMYELERETKLSAEEMELFFIIQKELDSLFDYLIGKGE